MWKMVHANLTPAAVGQLETHVKPISLAMHKFH